tara:strand:- start:5251 stop:8847 length:3597 start_codon:yes stop_codon:yes gene_type:complete
MNKIIKTIASAMAVFVLVFIALAMPLTSAIAVTGSEIEPEVAEAPKLELPEIELPSIEFDGTPDYLSGEEEVDRAESNKSGEFVVIKDDGFIECALEASRNLVTIGEDITLNWDAKGFNSIKINGEDVSGDSGSKIIKDLQETTEFTLKALSDDGSVCVQKVRVECIPPEEVPKECKLEVKKTANRENAVPGQEITYTIDVKNIGDKDCTGGGVRIVDELSDDLTYVSHETSSNISDGYANKSAYEADTHTLWFNGQTLTPGEQGSITVTTKVNEAEQCGNYYVENRAKATAKELDYFRIWSYSNIVKTKVENKCEKPEAPECPLVASDGRTIVNFEGLKLRTDQGIDKAFTASQNITFDAAEYDITLVSWDGYTNRVNATQPHEQWQLEFMSGDTVVGQSGIIGDLADRVIEDTKIEMVNDGYVLASAATAVRAAQPFYPDTTSANSLYPICAAIDEVPEDPTPKCEISGSPLVIKKGESSTLIWNADEVYAATLDQGIGAVAVNGSISVSPEVTTTYTYTGEWGVDDYVHCPITITVEEEPAPSCDLFTATPGTIMVGASSTLAWETTNAIDVFINNGIGSVAIDGSIDVTPLADIVYKLTAIGADQKTVECEVPVKVSKDEVPVCEYFTATPDSLPYGGGDVTLGWSTAKAATVTIAPNVGSVALVGTTSVNVTEGTNFILTATDDNGHEVSCQAPVAVADPVPFTCGGNVTFSASDTDIDRGEDITLNWNVTEADSVSISGINATSFSGSEEVSPSTDTTYVLTATKGNTSIECPLEVEVSSGGGGGGSSSPRCDLDISDKKIKSGEEITLTWDTSRAREVKLTDDSGKVLFTTEDYLSDEKEDYYDGSITIKPTRDTEYTLVAERGSRDRECSVEVEMEDDIVVLQTRDQQPLVAGISLSQVPYTGFEAGPFLTLTFYALLVAWALYVTYLLVARNRGEVPVTDAPVNPNAVAMERATETRPDLFAAATAGMEATAKAAPTNLPTGTVTVGYENEVNPHQVDDAIVTTIENRAHEQKALLSSDAVRHFVSTTSDEAEREGALDAVIVEAKKNYPLEDGWIVINEARMRNLCDVCQANEASSDSEPFIPATVPEGTGSLAEAIVTGNVVAAYDMIGNRPMFALADAAADLDAVYRKRRGNDVAVSEMLISETKDLSDEKIKSMIAALTGALDGTYTDEASAVKMAIMKAVKEVA